MMVATVGGLIFQARTAAGIVRQLKQQQWNAPERKGPYMQEAATRATAQTGHTVRSTAGPAAFLNDLAAAGLLSITPDSDVA